MSSPSYKLVASIPSLNISQAFALERGRRYLFGSAPMEPEMLVFSHDRSISRRQAWLEIVDETLHVERHPKASRPLNNDPALTTLGLKIGDSFKAGLTAFQFLIDHETQDERTAERTYTLSASDFAAVMRKGAAKKLIDILAAMPALSRDHPKPADFLVALCDHIHLHVPEILVSAWSVLSLDKLLEIVPLLQPNQFSEDNPLPQPSRYLVKKAISSLAQGCWVSQWSRDASASGATPSLLSSNAEWAMCVPVLLSERERFMLYATGTRNMDRVELRELQQVLAALGAMAKQHLLTAIAKERQGQIGQFFSPLLRPLLFHDAPETTSHLKPGEFEATICFFDLRGSARETENAALQNNSAMGIAEHFARLEKLLGEAANIIFETGGIVIDFQGDAILACWGVPLPGSSSNSIQQAITAARQIIEVMADYDWPMDGNNLRCGIGMTHGKVHAGLFAAHHLGQTLLAKYTVIGPAVNQAARLEALTKKFCVPVLIDGAVAKNLSSENHVVRRIAKVRPAGMNQVVEVYELVLPNEVGGSGLSADGVLAYQTALQLFESGDFEAAAEAMVPRDPIELFLSEHIISMRRHGAPANWDGVINLMSK
jgi:adenylate cyclase